MHVNWLKGMVLASACVLMLSRPALPGGCGVETIEAGRKTVFQDKQGRVVGTARIYKGKTVYYDKQGRVIGTARAYKGKRVYYDKQGRVVGRCVR